MDWRSDDLHLKHDHTECEKDWAELTHLRIVNEALLEALKACLNYIGNGYQPPELIQQARAAIAQAKGEST